MSLPRLIQSAEPFFFKGNENGVLLIHGFTGAPKEMRWMGEFLAQEGFTVLGIRLAGHATVPEDMLRIRWQDWSASVEDGYHLLNGMCRGVFLAGLSMGGILTLLSASYLPVAGIIAMSTPYELPPDPRLPYLQWLHWLQPRALKGPPDWRNPEAALDHVDYPYYPTRAIIELRDMLAEMRLALPRVQAPVLLMQSRQDGSVLPENMNKIYDALGTTDKEMIWLENSGHVITREPERQIVFQAAADFVRRVSFQSA